MNVRCEGAVRLVSTSEPGDAYERPEHPKIELDAQERLLAIASDQALAVTAFVSGGGDTVRVHDLRSRTKRGLAVGQPTILAAAIAPDGGSVIVLDEEGRVLRYDLTTHAPPAVAAARKPERGKHSYIDLAKGGRLWLVASGASIEVRLMRDVAPVATVDLSSLGEEVTSARFLPDARGFLATTSRGIVRRFELLVDRVGTTRDARVAAIADAVDAAIAGTLWERFAPRVEVYAESTGEGGLTTLYFVAGHYEYHQAQSGSDWAEQSLCSGNATFEGERCVEARVATTDRQRLTEREAEAHDSAATLSDYKRRLQEHRAAEERFWKGEYAAKDFAARAAHWAATMFRQMRWQSESDLDPCAGFNPEWFAYAKRHEPDFDRMFDYILERYEQEFLYQDTSPAAIRRRVGKT